MNIYVGTSGYSYSEWKGPFYPEHLPGKKMLSYYAKRFRTVEVNNTFYRMPQPQMLEAWAAEVPAGFSFAMKAPRRITHIQRLRDTGPSVSFLVQSAGVLREHLGPLLFQLPPRFRKDARLLREFLSSLPGGMRFAFEFRNESWFDDEVFGLLRGHNAALCIADTDDGPSVPSVATADWGYLRLRRAGYDDAGLESWARLTRKQHWRDVFVFFKHEEEGKGPLLARRFIELAA